MVSTGNRFFKRAFEKTIFRPDHVQKRGFRKHSRHFRRGFTVFFETTTKPQRDCEKHVFGRIILIFTGEFKVFPTRAREKYCKTWYFERQVKNEVDRWRNESMEIGVLRIYRFLKFYSNHSLNSWNNMNLHPKKNPTTPPIYSSLLQNSRESQNLAWKASKAL